MSRNFISEQQEELISETVIRAIEEEFPNPGTSITQALKEAIAKKCISVIDTAKKERITDIQTALDIAIGPTLELWHPPEMQKRIKKCVVEALSQMDSIVIGNGKPR